MRSNWKGGKKTEDFVNGFVNPVAKRLSRVTIHPTGFGQFDDNGLSLDLTEITARLSVKGTKAIGKGIFLRGYTRASTDSAWPSTPDSNDFTQAAGYYSTDGSGLHTLLETWDYPRVCP